MRKPLTTLSISAAMLLAFVFLQSVLGKGHVPIGQVQVAHRGEVIQISENALQAHLSHGDIQLPACDFNNVFFREQDVSNVIAADFTGVTYSDIGFVPRDSADGATPACPPGTF